MNSQEILVQLNSIRAEGLAAVSAANSVAQLKDLETALLGRKSAFSQIGRGLRDLSDEDRRRVGQLSNEVRTAIQSAARRAAERNQRRRIGGET